MLQIPIFLLLVIILSTLSTLVSKRFWKYCALLLSFSALFFWITANFVTPNTVDLGLLDGSEKKLSISLHVILGETAFMATSLVAYVTLFRRYHGVVLNLVLFLNVAILAPVVPTIFADFTEPRTNLESGSQGIDDFLRFSTGKNLLIVLMDEFESDFMDKLLSEDMGLAATFDGFTFFKDTLGVAPTTYLAMPSIHSGRYYRPNQSLPDFYREAVKEEGLLVDMAQRGADVSLMTPVMNICPTGASCLTPAEVLHDVPQGVMSELALLLDISTFRAVPHALKSSVYNEGRWLISNWLTEGRSLHKAVIDNELMRALAENLYVEGERPAVKFIHIMGTHRPYRLDRDCNRLEWAPYDFEYAMNTTRCAVAAFKEILVRLREENIYDDTMIVLLADHGAGARTKPLVPSSLTTITVTSDYSFRYKSYRKNWDSLWHPTRLNPLFMVKPLGARGMLVENETNAVSLVDLRGTACVFMDSCDPGVGESAFNQPSASERERKFFDYVWKTEYWGSAFIDDIVERSVITSIRSLIEHRKYVMKNSKLSLSFNQPVPNLGGLSFAEEWGTWTDGSEAVLAFQFESLPEADLELVVAAKPFVNEKHPQQEVDVVVNGERVGRWTYDTSRTIKQRATIPAELVKQQIPMTLTLRLRKAVSPSALGLSSGARQLGLGLSRLWLAEVAGER